MSSDVMNSEVPTSLSFREFRNEEIVGFFTNGHRTFRPPLAQGDEFGRQRIVGAAHTPSERKPTAAFRTALAAKKGNAADPFGKREKSVLHQSPTPTIPLPASNTKSETIPPVPSFGKQTRPLGVVAHGGRKIPPSKGRAARILVDPLLAFSAKSKGPKSPCPSSPGIRIDGGIKNLGEASSSPMDGDLAKLVDRWPRLSPALKEIIGTLVESAQ